MNEKNDFEIQWVNSQPMKTKDIEPIINDNPKRGKVERNISFWSDVQPMTIHYKDSSDSIPDDIFDTTSEPEGDISISGDVEFSSTFLNSISTNETVEKNDSFLSSDLISMDFLSTSSNCKFTLNDDKDEYINMRNSRIVDDINNNITVDNNNSIDTDDIYNSIHINNNIDSSINNIDNSIHSNNNINSSIDNIDNSIHSNNNINSNIDNINNNKNKIKSINKVDIAINNNRVNNSINKVNIDINNNRINNINNNSVNNINNNRVNNNNINIIVNNCQAHEKNNQNVNFPKNSIKFKIQRVETFKNYKILHGGEFSVKVSGEFSSTNFSPNQTVTVMNCFCCTGPFDLLTVNDEHNYLIVEDDVMAVTTFVTAMECVNLPLLKEKVAQISFEHTHPSLVLGIVMHEIIQSNLSQDNKSSNLFSTIIEAAKSSIRKNRILLYQSNISEKEALNEVLKHIKNILSFLKDHKIEKVEFGILSTLFNLKGSIDCLGKNSLIEIKTGSQMRVEHRSQVVLYSLLLREYILRNDDLCHNIPEYILYYLKSGSIIKFHPTHSEIVGLLKLKNDLSNKSLFNCNCPGNSICSIYNNIKNLENDNFLKMQLEGIELEDEKKFVRAEKIKQVNRLLTIRIDNKAIRESNYVVVYNSNYKRICYGEICFNSNLMSNSNINVESNINNNLLSNINSNSNVESKINNNVMSNNINVESSINSNVVSNIKNTSVMNNDNTNVKNIINSNINDSFTSINSTIKNINNNIVQLVLKDEINIECNILYIQIENNTNTIKFMMYSLINIAYFKYLKDLNNPIESNLTFNENSTGLDSFIFPQISQDEKFQNISNEEDKLLQINQNDTFKNISNEEDKDSHVKQDDKFRSISNEEDNLLHVKLNDRLQNISKYNQDERFKNISNEKEKNSLYNLKVKDQKINIVDFNNSSSFVYFTQPSNSSSEYFNFSIPEIFIKDFSGLNSDQRLALFLALNCKSYKIIHGMPGTGKTTVISLLIRILIHYNQKVLLVCYTNLAIDNILKRVESVRYYRANKTYNDEFSKEYFDKIDLVVGTCYSFDDIVYVNRKFDYCIIDEGSHIHFLLTLIPISRCRRFCIVGDHLQLKPLARKSKTLQFSLFEHLINDCSKLTFQYRIGDNIMRLSSTLFYDNHLKGFGGESRVILVDLTGIDYVKFIQDLDGYIRKIDQCNKEESICNNTTILCYFNNQVNVTKLYTNCLVTTIDRFQGSENDNILIVFDPIEKCEVLESKERLNVALTRARRNLILFGNVMKMRDIPILNRLLNII